MFKRNEETRHAIECKKLITTNKGQVAIKIQDHHWNMWQTDDESCKQIKDPQEIFNNLIYKGH